MATIEARPVGFFTDTSICIGCKACEVACKEWNQLEGNSPHFLDSFDNTGDLDAQNWRHVKFLDHVPDQSGTSGNGHKCTLCYDRLQGGLEPACAKACPTQSIQFGPLSQLQQTADVRLAALHSQG